MKKSKVGENTVKKVGIITFHNGSNYGAALQTYALQEAIRNENDEVIIINYQNKFISKGLNKVRFEFSIHGFYNAIFDLVHYQKNGKKIKNFQLFFEKYYNMSERMSAEELYNVGMFLDVGISGSDQIWNPLLNGKIDDIYFLNFPGVKVKSSYASSFGSYKFQDNRNNEIIKKLLESYTNISVRENGELLDKCIHRKIINVCDPTLLLSKSEWKKKLDLFGTVQNYLLIYAMTDFDNICEYAIKIAKERNLQIKYIGMPIKRKKNIQYILDAGPREFVQLFLDARYVVTNSFHGTAFSINFKKQFISLKNPKNPERVEFFLKSIGLSNRLVADPKVVPEDILEEEYFEASKILNDLVKKSTEYLKNVV